MAYHWVLTCVLHLAVVFMHACKHAVLLDDRGASHHVTMLRYLPMPETQDLAGQL